MFLPIMGKHKKKERKKDKGTNYYFHLDQVCLPWLKDVEKTRDNNLLVTFSIYLTANKHTGKRNVDIKDSLCN